MPSVASSPSSGFELLTPGAASPVSNTTDGDRPQFNTVISAGEPNTHAGISRNPLSPQPQSKLVSERGKTPEDDFYHRIHLDPPLVKLGNVLGREERQVRVWNAFFVPVTIQSFNAPNVEGLNTLVDPVGAYPFVAQALQELEYSFEVLTDGPAKINSAFSWIIEGRPVVFTITGSRIVVFTIPPNTRQPLRETLEWKTEVTETTFGTKSEERISHRIKPRVSISYRSIVMKPELSKLNNLLWGWQNRWFGVPMWRSVVHTEIDYLAGETFITLNQETAQFSAGGSLIFLDESGRFETANIDAVEENGLVIELPLQNNWLSGSKLYPQHVGKMPNNVQSKKITDGVVEFQFNFDFDHTTDPGLPDTPALETYQGVDLISQQPNWSRAIQSGSNFDFTLLDNQGAMEIFETADAPSIPMTYSWLFPNSEEAVEFRGFLRRMHGRRNTCFVPSWEQDFQIVKPILFTENGMTVKDNGYLRYVNLHVGRRDVFIQTVSKQHFARELLSVEEGEPGQLLLTFDGALGVDISLADVLRISFLNRMRFASDNISIEHITNTVSQVTANLIGVND